MIREAFLVAKSGRPGPVLVDITKDAQQATAEFDFAAAAPKPHRPHPMLKTESASILQAAELIRNAKRPVILAGHGILQSGAGAAGPHAGGAHAHSGRRRRCWGSAHFPRRIRFRSA